MHNKFGILIGQFTVFSKEVNEGTDLTNVHYTKDLRENQLPIIDVALSELNNNGGVVISAPCGEGKTAMALNLICELKKKTLILVHNENLLDQWIDRISFFTNVTSVGKIKGKIMDIDHDIVIGMIQSISMKSLPLKTFESFGTVVIDECRSESVFKSTSKGCN